MIAHDRLKGHHAVDSLFCTPPPESRAQTPPLDEITLHFSSAFDDEEDSAERSRLSTPKLFYDGGELDRANQTGWDYRARSRCSSSCQPCSSSSQLARPFQSQQALEMAPPGNRTQKLLQLPQLTAYSDSDIDKESDRERRVSRSQGYDSKASSARRYVSNSHQFLRTSTRALPQSSKPAASTLSRPTSTHSKGKAPSPVLGSIQRSPATLYKRPLTPSAPMQTPTMKRPKRRGPFEDSSSGDEELPQPPTRKQLNLGRLKQVIQQQKAHASKSTGTPLTGCPSGRLDLVAREHVKNSAKVNESAEQSLNSIALAQSEIGKGKVEWAGRPPVHGIVSGKDGQAGNQKVINKTLISDAAGDNPALERGSKPLGTNRLRNLENAQRLASIVRPERITSEAQPQNLHDKRMDAAGKGLETQSHVKPSPAQQDKHSEPRIQRDPTTRKTTEDVGIESNASASLEPSRMAILTATFGISQGESKPRSTGQAAQSVGSKRRSTSLAATPTSLRRTISSMPTGRSAPPPTKVAITKTTTALQSQIEWDICEQVEQSASIFAAATLPTASPPARIALPSILPTIPGEKPTNPDGLQNTHLLTKPATSPRIVQETLKPSMHSNDDCRASSLPRDNTAAELAVVNLVCDGQKPSSVAPANDAARNNGLELPADATPGLKETNVRSSSCSELAAKFKDFEASSKLMEYLSELPVVTMPGSLFVSRDSELAEPYFEYTVSQRLFRDVEVAANATSSDESTISRTFTSVEQANDAANVLYAHARDQYPVFYQIQFQEWTTKRDEHDCIAHLGVFTLMDYPSKKSYLKIWVERHYVSAHVAAIKGPPGNTSFIRKSLYILRLHKLLENCRASADLSEPSPNPDNDSSSDSSTGSESEDRAAKVNEKDNPRALRKAAALERKRKSPSASGPGRTSSFLRQHHPLPCTELYTTLDAANRAARRLQIELSHEENPSTLTNAKWQEQDAQKLMQKVLALDPTVGGVEGCWQSEFNASGPGGDRFELLVERVSVCGPRNL